MFSAAIKSGAAAYALEDPYFYTVPLLLSGDGTNGAQNNTFLDGSTNNFTITRNGNTTQGSYSPYGSLWSNYFNGSSNIFSGSNAAFGFGTGDFTVEFWLFLSASPASGSKYTLVDFRPTSSATPHTMYVANSSGTLYLGFYNGSSDVTSSSQPVTANTWVHCAYSRASGTLKIYVNGNQAYSAANTVDYQATRNLTLGTSVIVSEGTTGYFSNFRITKGAGLYTTAFNPSTVPLTTTVSSGTVTLLTCQGNGFVDASGTVALSLTSTPSVQRFSPFNPTAPYSTSVIGGSGYFDGTGDSLTTPSITIGTNAFCFECWVYPTTTQASFAGLFVGTTNSSAQIAYYSTTGLGIAERGVAWQLFETTVLPTVGQWNHIAFVRSSTSANQASIFLNGVRVANGTIAHNYVASAYNVAYNSSDVAYALGYFSDVRLQIGSTPYSASSTTITIPSAPLTAITNTSLLLNYTNAGIYDSAMMNDLETVGNAQISTSVKKYGTGSMAFDGTGDWLLSPNSVNLQLGTGDFTIEGWVYLTANGTAYGIVSKGAASTGWSVNITSGNKLQFSYTATSLTGATSLSANTWYYFSVIRLGSASGNLKIYLNGSADATSGGAVTDDFNQADSMYVGASRTGTTALNGYIDDLRISKGLARYTANFTPPTAALQNY